MFLTLTPRQGRIILAVFGGLLVIGFLMLDHLAPAGRRLAKISGYDPVNYFATSHSLLFDRDFDLTNEFTHVAPASDLWTKPRPETGLPGSPWGVGYSLLGMPFLATGTAIDAAVGNPPDGYGPFAILVYCLGNVVLSSLGLFALFSLLYRAAPLLGIREDRSVTYGILVTLLVFFGTNVGYYTFSQMAHAASFLFASMFLAFWWKIRSTHNSRDWLLLGLIGGLLSIIRWQDVLYLGGPALFDLMEREPWKSPWPWLRSRLLYAAGVAVCWIPQVIQWKTIYAKYLTIPQGDGFFSFPPPYVQQVLFSSRNGWFLWTPIALLGVVGLLYGVRRAASALLPWVVVLGLEIGVIGSMATWHGYDSFSSRYLLAMSPVIGLGLLALLAVRQAVLRRALAAAMVCSCLYTTAFALQFRLGLIPSNATLTLNEVVTDKLRLPQVWHRRVAVSRARALLDSGDAAAAIRTIEATSAWQQDRHALALMSKAQRAAGNEALALEAESRLRRLLASRLK